MTVQGSFFAEQNDDGFFCPAEKNRLSFFRRPQKQLGLGFSKRWESTKSFYWEFSLLIAQTFLKIENILKYENFLDIEIFFRSKMDLRPFGQQFKSQFPSLAFSLPTDFSVIDYHNA